MTNEQFKQRMKQLNLSYKELSELTGYSAQYLRMIACGARKVTKYLELFLKTYKKEGKL